MSDFNDGILPTPCLRMGTHFGDEYESVEFGDGTGYIKAAPILAKVGALHEEIDRLRDESAELRKHVRMPDEPLEIDEKDFYVRAFIKWAIEEQPEVKRLEAENVKLRELVRHLHTCLDHYEPGDTISCEQCPYDNETWGCDYERLMAELGIEVDA